MIFLVGGILTFAFFGVQLSTPELGLGGAPHQTALGPLELWSLMAIGAVAILAGVVLLVTQQHESAARSRAARQAAPPHQRPSVRVASSEQRVASSK